MKGEYYMRKIMITKTNKKEYQSAFVLWMNQKYPSIKRSDIMSSNAMYSINRDCGFSINHLIEGKITLDEYRDCYEQYFEKILRKSPKGHANVQKWCARYFIEFINEM
jgi:hypothetical protein